MPTMTMSVRRIVRASLIRKPSPELAPTSSAATSAIQPTPRPMRMPVTICGSAARTTTWLSTVHSSLPRQRAARTRFGSTPLTPVMVLSRIGKKMPRKMMNWFCRSPMPNHRIDSGIQASGGIGLSISTSESTCSLKPFHQPIATPSGMATSDHRKATNSRRSESNRWRKSSPETMSSQAAAATAVGGGSKARVVSSSTRALMNCQTTSSTIGSPSRRSRAPKRASGPFGAGSATGAARAAAIGIKAGTPCR